MDPFPDLGDDPSGPPRSVVYEDAAGRHVDQREAHYPRLPALMRYVEWQLARNPANEYAVQMPFPNADTWLFKIGPYPALGIPAVVVLYRFDEQRVTSGTPASRTAEARLLCCKPSFRVIPAQAGIQKGRAVALDSRFRGNDRAGF